jgi:hypothetical protein
MPIALWRLFLDRPPRVAALWMEFMGADRPQVAYAVEKLHVQIWPEI